MPLSSASRLRQKPSDGRGVKNPRLRANGGARRPARGARVSFSSIVPCVIVALMAPNQTQQQPEELLPLSPQVFHVLLALAGGDQHGYAIMQDVAYRTDGKLRLSPGTLYGSVKRMLEQGLII